MIVLFVLIGFAFVVVEDEIINGKIWDPINCLTTIKKNHHKCDVD